MARGLQAPWGVRTKRRRPVHCTKAISGSALAFLLWPCPASAAEPSAGVESPGSETDAPTTGVDGSARGRVYAFETKRLSPLGRVTLPDAVQRALDANPQVEMARARVEEAEAQRTETWSGFLPSVSAYWSYGRGNTPSGALFARLNQRRLPPQPNFNEPGVFEDWQLGLEAGVNLFRGGRKFSDRRLSEIRVERRRLERARTFNRLEGAVVRAYFDILAARAFVEIAQAAQQTIQARLERARIQMEGGALLKSDLLSLQVRSAKTDDRMVRSENRLRLARANLAELMGVDVDRPFEVAPSSDAELDVPEGYEAGLTEALRQRPELAIARKAVESARVRRAQSWQSWFPSLDARVRAFVAAPAFDEFRLDDGNWDIGLNLRWRLFDGLSRPARTRQAEAMVKVMRARDERATRMVQLEVMTAYTNLEGAVSRLGTAKEALEQAKEALRLVTIEREGGAATLTRYLQTQSAETEARMRLAAARFDVRTARADVARSLGRFAETTPKRASTDAEVR